MGRLVREHDLGVVAASLAPDDLASAIRQVLDRPDEERAATRSRIAALAAERFSWPAAAADYRALVEELAGSAADPGNDGDAEDEGSTGSGFGRTGASDPLRS